LLIVLALLAALVALLLIALLLVAYGRRDLLRRLFGRCRLDLLLVALLLARLLLVGRGLAALVSGRGLDLLLLVALLAWLDRLLVGRRLATLVGGRGLDLLLLIALLARLELLLGRGSFPRLAIVHLLLLVPLLARLLLSLGGRGLLGCRRRFALLLLLALLFPWLFATLLAGLGAFLGRLAFGASGLGQDERRAIQAGGSDTPLQRVRAQRRGCHKQADCRARQNPWLAFHINFLLVGSHPCPNFH
jgi:hypothetical protein